MNEQASKQFPFDDNFFLHLYFLLGKCCFNDNDGQYLLFAFACRTKIKNIYSDPKLNILYWLSCSKYWIFFLLSRVSQSVDGKVSSWPFHDKCLMKNKKKNKNKKMKSKNRYLFSLRSTRILTFNKYLKKHENYKKWKFLT